MPGTIPAEGDGGHPVVVDNPGAFLPGGGLPDPGRLVGAGGGQQPTVRAEGDPGDLSAEMERPDERGVGDDLGDRWCGVGQHALDRLEQPFGVIGEALVTHRQGVAPGKTGQWPGKVAESRHRRALDEDRDHPHVAFQGRLELQPDEVVGVLEPSPAVSVGRRDPLRADHRQQHLAGADRTGDDLGEVDPQVDGGDIHEHPLGAEALGEPVVQPSGEVAALLTPIADEDAARQRSRHGSSPPHRRWKASSYRPSCPSGPVTRSRPGCSRLQSHCHGLAQDRARPDRKGECHDNDRAGAGGAWRRL
jgi:hypothetical protein